MSFISSEPPVLLSVRGLNCKIAWPSDLFKVSLIFSPRGDLRGDRLPVETTVDTPLDEESSEGLGESVTGNAPPLEERRVGWEDSLSVVLEEFGEF